MDSEVEDRIDHALRTHSHGLHLSGLNLRSLPESLENLTSLTELELGNNNLTELPDWLGNLTSLTELELGNNNLTELPDSLGNLSSLTQLDCERTTSSFYQIRWETSPPSPGSTCPETTSPSYLNR